MLCSSRSVEWRTPRPWFEEWDAEYGPFDLDPCCTTESALCPNFYTREDNGLAKLWFGRVFMNPPYGKTIGQWMRKAWEESRRGALVVCLVPARTDTAWWHEYAMRGAVRFLRGRMKSPNAMNSAPFPNAIVVFRPLPEPAAGRVGPGAEDAGRVGDTAAPPMYGPGARLGNCAPS